MGRPLRPRKLPGRAEILGHPEPEMRARIIQRYARMNTSRPFPVYCNGTPEDEQGSATKIVYDTLDQARQCAIDLVHAGCAKSWPYQCHRTDEGHYHLTRKKRGHDVQELFGADVAPRIHTQEKHSA